MLDLNDGMLKLIGNRNILRKLTADIKHNRVIPFVGAGMSIDIYGSWGSALERIMDGHIFGRDAEEIKSLIDRCQYEEAAEKIKAASGETCYHDQLVAVFGEDALIGDTPALNDEVLKKMSVRYLPKIFKDSLVVTTNFDKVLERVFLREQNSFVEKIVLSHLTDWQAENVRRGTHHYLIKIHGCVSAPDEVVMTKEKYDKLYKENSKPIERLRDILSANKLLFIGCSLNEDRTVDLLKGVGQGGHYAILEMNGEAEDPDFNKRKLFMANELKMHCIWYPKDQHHYVGDILEYIYADVTGQIPDGCKETAKAPVRPDLKPIVKNEPYIMGRWKGKPLEWLVLDVQPDRALLIAKDCLLTVPYNEKQCPISWQECSLRQKVLPSLLNEEKIFDEAERAKILRGEDTPDEELFLLSKDEAKLYFPYDEARVARLNGDTACWWLRSPGFDPRHAALVHLGGFVIGHGLNVGWAGGAVRPAFWLNRKS